MLIVGLFVVFAGVIIAVLVHWLFGLLVCLLGVILMLAEAFGGRRVP